MHCRESQACPSHLVDHWSHPQLRRTNFPKKLPSTMRVLKRMVRKTASFRSYSATVHYHSCSQDTTEHARGHVAGFGGSLFSGGHTKLQRIPMARRTLSASPLVFDHYLQGGMHNRMKLLERFWPQSGHTCSLQEWLDSF